MVIVGAGGLAKEVLDIINESEKKKLFFFDNVNDAPSYLYREFPILRNREEIELAFKEDNRFCIAVGGAENREKLYFLLKKWGGTLTSIISPKAIIGKYNVNIGNGCKIFPGVNISNNVSIGKACLLYYNSTITHDVIIEDFVEISPGAILLGNCVIKKSAHIGAGAIILPKVIIGENSIIGAGAVVTKNIPDNVKVKGVPAKIY